MGALATAVLVVNNARDHQTDVRAGKRTLVVRFGRRFANLEYGALVAAAYLAPAVMALTGLARPGVLAPWLTCSGRSLAVRAGHAGRGPRLEPAVTCDRTCAAGGERAARHRNRLPMTWFVTPWGGGAGRRERAPGLGAARQAGSYRFLLSSKGSG